MYGGRQFKIPCHDFKKQDNADLRIYSIKKKLIHSLEGVLCFLEIWGRHCGNKDGTNSFPWYTFYNIIKSWYGTSPDTDSYGLNLGSDLTSDQDREITDILRKRVWILSIDFVKQGWIWLQLLDEVSPQVHLLFEHLD